MDGTKECITRLSAGDPCVSFNFLAFVCALLTQYFLLIGFALLFCIQLSKVISTLAEAKIKPHLSGGESIYDRDSKSSFGKTRKYPYFEARLACQRSTSTRSGAASNIDE